jgi:hypothetical protein
MKSRRIIKGVLHNFLGTCAREARLHVMKLDDLRPDFVNGRMSDGHTVLFVASVVSDYGKTYEHEVSVFVAPHDAKVEARSARGC